MRLRAGLEEGPRLDTAGYSRLIKYAVVRHLFGS